MRDGFRTTVDNTVVLKKYLAASIFILLSTLVSTLDVDPKKCCLHTVYSVKSYVLLTFCCFETV